MVGACARLGLAVLSQLSSPRRFVRAQARPVRGLDPLVALLERAHACFAATRIDVRFILDRIGHPGAVFAPELRAVQLRCALMYSDSVGQQCQVVCPDLIGTGSGHVVEASFLDLDGRMLADLPRSCSRSLVPQPRAHGPARVDGAPSAIRCKRYGAARRPNAPRAGYPNARVTAHKADVQASDELGRDVAAPRSKRLSERSGARLGSRRARVEAPLPLGRIDIEALSSSRFGVPG